MGTSGVPWKANKTAIIDILKKRNGVVSLAAQDLGINRHTLTKKIQEDSDLQETLGQLRNDFVEQKLDSAEDTIAFAIHQRDTDLGSALKAAFFILNNLGRRRGYVHPRIAEKETEINYTEIRNQIIIEQEVEKRVAQALAKKKNENP